MVAGVGLSNGETISAKFIVSNADARSTFEELLSCECQEKQKIKQLEISPSAFVVYLGMAKDLKETIGKNYVTWLFSTYDIDACYDVDKYYNLDNGNFDVNYLMCHSPSVIDASLAPKGKSGLRIMIWVKYANENIWEKNKNNVYKKIINRLKGIIPDVDSSIELKVIATPNTFHKLTSNYHGAVFGWASTVNQIDRNVFSPVTSLKGLYLTGHWVTTGLGQSGICTVASCGKNVAKILLRDSKKVRIFQ